MTEILDYNVFCQELKEVTSTKIFNKRKFHPEGLFSEQIFGPLNNYTCQCGIYYGVSKSGGVCDICGVDVIRARTRRERFAKIILPFKVVNPLFYDLFATLAGSKIKGFVDVLMRDDTSFLVFSEENFIIIKDSDQAQQYQNKWEGLDAIYELVRKFAEEGHNQNIPEWSILYNNLDKLLIQDIIVLPPELRPTSMKANVNELDEINRFYIHILMKKSIIEGTILDVSRDKKLFYHYYRQIQKNVNELYNQILIKLSKKEGLIRSNILGKRIDFSGRAVIVPDPTINLNECVIPYIMFLELFKLEISRKLIDLEKFKLLNNAIDFVDECIDKENPVLFDVCQNINQNKVCLLNRQPSLHRLSMIGFYMKLSMDKVIKIHPLVTGPLNADHDGDSLFAFVSIKSKNKLINTHMEDVLTLDLFEFKSEKTKTNGIKVKKYSPKEEVTIKSIDPNTGKTDWKQISEFSVHENLNMYSIEDPKKRFERFWSSEDHSLIVFDETDNKIKKISPKELQINPDGKYLIQEENHEFSRSEKHFGEGS